MPRLKWLQKHLSSFSLSRAWRWYYRLGFRKGKQRGIEIGRQSVAPINRCPMHDLPTYPRTIQVADGRWIEMWCCPMWHAHTIHPAAQQMSFADYEAHTDPQQVKVPPLKQRIPAKDWEEQRRAPVADEMTIRLPGLPLDEIRRFRHAQEMEGQR